MATRKKSEPAVAQPAEPPKITLQLVLAFTVDGTPVVRMPVALHLPIPPAGEAGMLELTIDGRRLLAALEPALGPTRASHGGLIVPNGVLPLRRKQDD